MSEAALTGSLLPQDASDDSLTPKQESMCLALAEGADIRDACARVGVDLSTGYRWLKKPNISARIVELAKMRLASVSGEAVEKLISTLRAAEPDTRLALDSAMALLDLSGVSAAKGAVQSPVTVIVDLG